MEQALDLSLVAMVGGNRALVSIAQVGSWLLTHCDIPEDSVMIQQYFPEDFLITFSFYNDMLRVLHNPLCGNMPSILVFKRWRR
jgi:hypothetical protein